MKQRGFTLIEVAVAFAVFALCIGALYESFSGSMRRSSQLRQANASLMLAQSLLAEYRLRSCPCEPTQAGESGGLAWRVDVIPYDAGADPKAQWRAFRVTVQVSSKPMLQSVEMLRVVE
jgi:general secretion pathway protein I